MSTTIKTIKNPLLGILLSLILGVIFLSLSFLIGSSITGGTCEYLCAFDSCLVPERECTSNDLLFWKYATGAIGAICLLIGIVEFFKHCRKV